MLKCAYFVDRDDVSGHDLLLLDRIDHLVPQVVHSLHLGGLQRDLPRLVSCGYPVILGLTHRLVDLYLHHLSLYDLRLLLDANA